MLFNSLTYVFFLLAVVVLYWSAPKSWRPLLLLIASYIFYMSWSPPYGLIFGPVIFLDSLYFYALSCAMIRWPARKKTILTFGIVSELLFLATFKYSNLILGAFESVLRGLNLNPPHYEFNIILPLAISFTSFVLISYLVDVYRGHEKPDSSFIRFATYVAFFPHLIAGPIVRASELLAQIDRCPRFKLDGFIGGINKFLTGLALKVFIADGVATYVNQIYGTPDLQAFNTCWIATYGFAIQIFCDFFGYTLMAQGSALMLGYRLPENFDAPYFSANITDFWRRWHMSLSRWLKDYLYIPLGGSRGSSAETYRNLFMTMGLGGLWHGASWTFMIWGLYHGLLLSLHKVAGLYGINRLVPKAAAFLLTFHAVCIGWVFFRAQTLSQAMTIVGEMFRPMHLVSVPGSNIVLIVILLFLVFHWLARQLKPLMQQGMVSVYVHGAAYFLLIYLGLSMPTASSTFLYFQF